MRYLKTAKAFWDTLPFRAKTNLTVTCLAGVMLVWMIGDTVGQIVKAVALT